MCPIPYGYADETATEDWKGKIHCLLNLGRGGGRQRLCLHKLYCD